MMGGIASLIVATAIMLSSWILSVGNYGNYPDINWSKGVGLSMLTFGMSTIILGTLLLLFGPMGWIGLTLGVAATLIIAATIVAASYILGLGKYDKYPNSEWIGGVGKSFMLLGLSAIGLALLGPLLVVGLSLSLVVAGSIYLIDKILSSGVYKSFPNENWINGVGLTITKFGNIIGNLGFDIIRLMIGLPIMVALSGSILAIDKILSAGQYSKYPNQEWINGINAIVKLFSKGDFRDIKNNIYGLVMGLRAFEDIDDKVTSSIDKLAKSLSNLSQSVSGLDVNKLQALNKLSDAFLVISVIDQEELNKTLSIIDKKAASIKKVIDMSSTAGRMETNNKSTGPSAGGAEVKSNEVVVKDIDKILTHIVSIDTNIGKMSKIDKSDVKRAEEPIPNTSNVNTTKQ